MTAALSGSQAAPEGEIGVRWINRGRVLHVHGAFTGKRGARDAARPEFMYWVGQREATVGT